MITPEILVVEDNKMNQKVVLSMLAKMGLKTDLAENGQEALAKLSQKNYALVLMDCQMPIMDGYEATQKFRASDNSLNKALPIIAMTAHAMPGDRERCINSGMNDYMTKPVTFAGLGQMVNKWLAHVATLIPSNDTVRPRARNDDEPALVDENVIRGLAPLKKPGKQSLLGELIDLFVKQVPERLEIMELALKEHDAEKFERAAHSLKGSSGILGAIPMMHLAEILQNLGRAKNLADVEKPFSELRELWPRTRLAILRHRPED